jgi:hypothetical protein
MWMSETPLSWVDHAHQRVVGLLDGLVLVGPVLGAFLLQREQQVLGVARRELQRLQAGVDVAAVGEGADLLVGRVQRPVEVAALGQHGHDLHLRAELGLVDGAVAVGRVVHRDDQAAVVQHQRHDLQPLRRRVAELAQGLGVDRERVDVHQRIAHLARQRDLQVRARDRAAVDQQFAHGHAPVELLARQRLGELLGRDHAQGDQRLADAHHRHAALARDGAQQVVGGRDDARGQRGADAAFGGRLGGRRVQVQRFRLAHRCTPRVARPDAAGEDAQRAGVGTLSGSSILMSSTSRSS